VKSTIKKWGNSAAVRIPTSVMQAMDLDLGDMVEVHAEAGRLVIEKAQRKTYDVNDLIRRITIKNRHQAVDFGSPAGREIW
jgi:antitoxin MazE